MHEADYRISAVLCVGKGWHQRCAMHAPILVMQTLTHAMEHHASGRCMHTLKAPISCISRNKRCPGYQNGALWHLMNICHNGYTWHQVNAILSRSEYLPLQVASPAISPKYTD